MKNISLFTLALLTTMSVYSQAIQSRKSAKEEAVRERFQKFISAENSKDTTAVNDMLWQSPDMVFAPFGKKDTAVYNGYWGTENVMDHLKRLYRLGIQLQPDYGNERIAFINSEVAEVFVPAEISFPNRAAASFLLITYWVKLRGEWKLSTDIAIPVNKL